MKKSRILLSILLVGILALAGCTSGNTSKKKQVDPNIAMIKTVLEKQVTGPDADLKKALESPNPPAGIEAYTNKEFKKYFTDASFESFVSAYALRFTFEAHKNGFTLAYKDAKVNAVKGEKGAYDYTVTFVAKKSGKDDQTIEVTGRFNVNDDHKIVHVRYNDEDFAKAMAAK
ncbi:hypothetical protein ACFCYN_00005 [Gottfriedia sp. NPDC056225]|uniref:hypothetical protein n=1 Tax=Gottfriedia sp. NPDC056225 TaxID=3345751 RepID=UPI001559D703|nr:hypothetical protein HPK19_14365 [Arthrobacter citreus]QKE74143.1 hypothetical protein HPK19_15695 [Arthrobacter citreus]